MGVNGGGQSDRLLFWESGIIAWALWPLVGRGLSAGLSKPFPALTKLSGLSFHPNKPIDDINICSPGSIDLDLQDLCVGICGSMLDIAV